MRHYRDFGVNPAFRFRVQREVKLGIASTIERTPIDVPSWHNLAELEGA